MKAGQLKDHDDTVIKEARVDLVKDSLEKDTIGKDILNSHTISSTKDKVRFTIVII